MKIIGEDSLYYSLRESKDRPMTCLIVVCQLGKHVLGEHWTEDHDEADDSHQNLNSTTTRSC